MFLFVAGDCEQAGKTKEIRGSAVGFAV